MRYCLDSHPDLAVPPETDFLLPLLSALGDDASMTGFNDIGYERSVVRNKLADFARSFHDAYAASWGAASGWLDKSPSHAVSPGLLATAFPNARFLILHRYPLDQIHSFTRGGSFVHSSLAGVSPGRETVLAAAQYWRRATGCLHDFDQRDDLATESVSYEALCATPRETLALVLAHLELPWSENVVSYHKFDHDLGREAGRVSGTVGFSASQGGWHKWPQKWVEDAWDVVGDLAVTVGYQAP